MESALLARQTYLTVTVTEHPCGIVVDRENEDDTVTHFWFGL
jgi:hypothetical protein